jgi:hypothetical protein
VGTIFAFEMEDQGFLIRLFAAVDNYWAIMAIL